MTYMTVHRPTLNPFRFYNSLFTGPFTQEYGWRPLTDITETDHGYDVRVELPGVSKDDINISVRDRYLTIKGEKRLEKVDDTNNYQRSERQYGSFERTFTLPHKVETDNITSVYKDGVLTLSVPKPEEVKPKEIPITVESATDAPQES